MTDKITLDDVSRYTRDEEIIEEEEAIALVGREALESAVAAEEPSVGDIEINYSRTINWRQHWEEGMMRSFMRDEGESLAESWWGRLMREMSDIEDHRYYNEEDYEHYDLLTAPDISIDEIMRASDWEDTFAEEYYAFCETGKETGNVPMMEPSDELWVMWEEEAGGAARETFERLKEEAKMEEKKEE